MKSKKLVSLFLAIAMVFAMAVPAFASGAGNRKDSSEQTTQITGTGKGYKVDLTVGATAAVIVNPYKIEYTPTGFEEPQKAQIINAGTFITNNTDIPLKVAAKVKATVPTTSEAVLLTAVNQVNNTTAGVALGSWDATHENYTAAAADATPAQYMPKGVFLTFEILKCNDAETEPTNWKDAKSITIPTPNSSGDIVGATSTVLTTTDQVLNECLKFDPVGEEDEPSYACFHLAGYMNVYPQKIDSTTQPSAYVTNEWKTTDTVDATVVLTFLPDVDASPIT